MTRAFDSALFIPANPNAGEVVEIASPGPPLKTQFNTYIGGPPGVVVEASVPAATGQGQSLLSGPGPDFEWEPVVSSSLLPTPTGPGQTYVSDSGAPPSMQLAPAVPQAVAAAQLLFSGVGAGNPWQLASVTQVLTAGGALTIAGGQLVRGAALTFVPVTTGVNTVLDGGDPTKSVADNFTIDAGTF